jgi:cbb3-type cytochrome oxidase subunit 3
MYKYILQSVEHINWLATAILLLFVVVFAGMTVWVFTKKKDYIDKMSNLPLEDEE